MSPYILKFEIKDILPKSLNKELRTNRFLRNKQNKMWDALVYSLVRKSLPPEPLTKALISLNRGSYRMLDYDGLVGSMKPVVDALVSAGVLLDDRWSVTGPWIVGQEYRPKKQGSLLSILIVEEE